MLNCLGALSALFARGPPNLLRYKLCYISDGYVVELQMDNACVVMELPTGTGRIVYLAYEYQEPDVGWVHALVAASAYPDFLKH